MFANCSTFRNSVYCLQDRQCLQDRRVPTGLHTTTRTLKEVNEMMRRLSQTAKKHVLTMLTAQDSITFSQIHLVCDVGWQDRGLVQEMMATDRVSLITTSIATAQVSVKRLY